MGVMPRRRCQRRRRFVAQRTSAWLAHAGQRRRVFRLADGGRRRDAAARLPQHINRHADISPRGRAARGRSARGSPFPRRSPCPARRNARSSVFRPISTSARFCCASRPASTVMRRGVVNATFVQSSCSGSCSRRDGVADDEKPNGFDEPLDEDELAIREAAVSLRHDEPHARAADLARIRRELERDVTERGVAAQMLEEAGERRAGPIGLKAVERFAGLQRDEFAADDLLQRAGFARLGTRRSPGLPMEKSPSSSSSPRSVLSTRDTSRCL